jgi:hypothetical protein
MTFQRWEEIPRNDGSDEELRSGLIPKQWFDP